MVYSHEVENMCVVKKGPNHGPAPIPEEGKWIKAKEVADISGFTHGIGWCAPQQGACNLLSLDPLTLLRDWSRTVVRTLLYNTHVFYFV